MCWVLETFLVLIFVGVH